MRSPKRSAYIEILLNSMTDDVDQKRRQFLIKTTTLLSSIGIAATTIPFIKSLQPTATVQAKAAPIQVDISSLKPGQQMVVEWQAKPVWIIHRTAEELAALTVANHALRDPDSLVEQQPAYAKNSYRSIRPEILVLIGICTHLGCIPNYEPASLQNRASGFICPCHGSKFDMAGRVFKNVPAPINLLVPHYTYLNPHTLLIGADHA